MQKVLFVGLEEEEFRAITARTNIRTVFHSSLPGVRVYDGTLWAEREHLAAMTQVSHVIFHGIFADDLDLMAALALWGGPCLPNPRGMMDCRLKLPCLVRALEVSRFDGLPRGYVSTNAFFPTDEVRVAKWGNWHCGENKARFDSLWSAQEPTLIEDFIPGQSVRVMMVGEQVWQMHLEGDDWRKSIHHGESRFMEPDSALVEDTKAIKAHFGLELIANDYIIGKDGTPYLLEVNHIPSITCFPQVRQAYIDMVVEWIKVRVEGA